MIGVETLPDRERRPLSMEDVRALEDAGLYELARIAEKYVLRAQRPWWKRWFT